MSTNACLFVVAVRHPDLWPAIRARAASLTAFYGAGEGDALWLRECGETACVGAVGSSAPTGLTCWGAPFARLRPPTPRAVIAASDDWLRDELVGWGMAVAVDDRGTLRIVTAPSGPTGGYHAAGDGVDAWASHAVAAAWLAHGRAEVDVNRIPELLAFDFVGGGRSLVARTRALPPATVVDAGEPRSFWPPADRWAPGDPAAAHERTERALLTTLDRRLRGGTTALGMTAGADSRVLAVALAELGLPVVGFTWGGDDWPEALGARDVAATLGIPWSAALHWRDDGRTWARFQQEMRWADGCANVAPGERAWPAADTVLTGAAGEIGRAFYYRTEAGGPPPRDASRIADLLHPEGRLPHASTEARRAARTAVTSWAEAALASGRTGWEALDVLYAEQRVVHWARTQIPRLDATFAGGFMPVAVANGLASLPLAEKLTDGFHRRFVAARHPGLALPAPAPPPAPPAPAVATGRGSRLADRVRRRLARRRPAPFTPVPANPLLVALWAERPATQARVLEALDHPLLADALGPRWCAATRAAFLAGNDDGHQRACLACGPVALAEALHELH